MEDTENLKKAREIDRKLNAMKDDMANDGNNQLADKKKELADLERDLADLWGKVKDQDKDLGDLDAKIAALKAQIESAQKKKNGLADDAGYDNLTRDRDDYLAAQLNGGDLEAKLQELKANYMRKL